MSGATRVSPARSLMGAKPHRYVHSLHTDIRRTFRVVRRLQSMQEWLAQAADTSVPMTAERYAQDECDSANGMQIPGND